jgi:hypothetical protein
MDTNAYKIAALFVILATHSVAAGDNWMAWPSSYTHDNFGQRVDQHAQPVAPLAQRRADFQRSGYRHYRSTLQAGNSMDNMHIVEQWGAPIEPYEAWRFPFRPYGSPYPAWGPPTPYGIFNGNFGGGFHPQAGFGVGPGQGQAPIPPNNMNPGGGYPGGAYPGNGYPGWQNPGWQNPGNGFPLSPPYQNQPWYDGTYPAAPPLDTSSDRDFFYKPTR